MPDELAKRALEYFREVHREVFDGDPAANPTLEVEVFDHETVGAFDTLVLVTPWALNGMIFSADGEFPAKLRVGPVERPVLVNEVAALGTYASVGLVPDVSHLATMDEARTTARRMGDLFRKGLLAAIDEDTVESPARRSLIRGHLDEG